jgi:peroxiredoxin
MTIWRSSVSDKITLQEELDAFKAAFEAGKPPYRASKTTVDQMHRATAELRASGAAERALKVGDKAPSFELHDSEATWVSSEKLLAQGPLIVSFYRGVWCPYCNIELKALERTLPRFQSMGASLVAISPQTRSNNRRSVRRNNLTYAVLSDAHNKIAAEFGLVFTLPHYLVELYKSASIDLAIFNDDPSWTLPMPARYVIGIDRVILYSEVNPDYTRRPDPEDMLSVLTSIVSAK